VQKKNTARSRRSDLELRKVRHHWMMHRFTFTLDFVHARVRAGPSLVGGPTSHAKPTARGTGGTERGSLGEHACGPAVAEAAGAHSGNPGRSPVGRAPGAGPPIRARVWRNPASHTTQIRRLSDCFSTARVGRPEKRMPCLRRGALRAAPCRFSVCRRWPQYAPSGSTDMGAP